MTQYRSAARTAVEKRKRQGQLDWKRMDLIKRVCKYRSRDQLDCEFWRRRAAARVENKEFASRPRSADTKEAIKALIEKRPPDFTRSA